MAFNTHHLKAHVRDVKHLAAPVNLRIAIEQRCLAGIAALGQRVPHDDVWPVCLLQRLARVPAQLPARGHAQRGRLFQVVRRWRLAGVLAVLARLPFELLDAQTQSFDFARERLHLPLQRLGCLAHGLAHQLGGGVGFLHGFKFDINPLA